METSLLKVMKKLCTCLLFLVSVFFFFLKNNLNKFVTEHVRVNYMQEEVYVKEGLWDHITELAHPA